MPPSSAQRFAVGERQMPAGAMRKDIPVERRDEEKVQAAGAWR